MIDTLDADDQTGFHFQPEESLEGHYEAAAIWLFQPEHTPSLAQ